jgi:hypothetical protein
MLLFLVVCVFGYVLVCFSYVYTFISALTEYKDVRYVLERHIVEV